MTAVNEETPVLPRAHAGACAAPPAPAAKEVPSFPLLAWARMAGEAAGNLAALANKPGTLAHAQPPTFWQAWDRHKECAGHFSSDAARVARLAWGVLHVAVLLWPLYLAAWILESPARTVITAALGAAVWYFWAPAGF